LVYSEPSIFFVDQRCLAQNIPPSTSQLFIRAQIPQVLSTADYADLTDEKFLPLKPASYSNPAQNGSVGAKWQAGYDNGLMFIQGFLTRRQDSLPVGIPVIVSGNDPTSGVVSNLGSAIALATSKELSVGAMVS
jgi:hypothetical protein